jgi:hypothetical protein
MGFVDLTARETPENKGFSHILTKNVEICGTRKCLLLNTLEPKILPRIFA